MMEFQIEDIGKTYLIKNSMSWDASVVNIKSSIHALSLIMLALSFQKERMIQSKSKWISSLKKMLISQTCQEMFEVGNKTLKSRFKEMLPRRLQLEHAN